MKKRTKNQVIMPVWALISVMGMSPVVSAVGCVSPIVAHAETVGNENDYSFASLATGSNAEKGADSVEVDLGQEEASKELTATPSVALMSLRAATLWVESR